MEKQQNMQIVKETRKSLQELDLMDVRRLF